MGLSEKEVIKGHCSCGVEINKIINDNSSPRLDGVRYVYGDNAPETFKRVISSTYTIFRCENCKEVISDNFIELKEAV